jgi:8-oxo-dGTP diphosphatase
MRRDTNVIVGISMKARRLKSFTPPIMAAGGIVIAAGRTPLFAIVQRRKDDEWVLPKGKLKPRESVLAAAQREAREETGHRVAVQEYLGVVSYETGDGPKIVQFWRMRSLGSADQRLMRDIKAVKWLPLDAAIARLTFPIERAFLAQVGERSLRLARRRPSPRPSTAQHRPRTAPDAGIAGEEVFRTSGPASGATRGMFHRLLSRLHPAKTDDAALRN